MAGEWEDVEYHDPREIIPAIFKGARVTSTSRSDSDPLSRRNPRSKHINNPNAFDMAPIKGMTYEQFQDTMRQNGYEISNARDEVKNPSAWATGPHWHGVISKGPPNGGWEDAETPSAPQAIASLPEGASSDPLAAAVAGTPEYPDIQGRVQSPLGDQVAGSALPEAPEGNWGQRVWHALQTGVLPPEYKDVPFAQQVDALLKVMNAGTEAVRGTPLEGLMLSSPLGGAEIGGTAALGRMARGIPREVRAPDGSITRVFEEAPTEGLTGRVTDTTPVNDNAVAIPREVVQGREPDFIVPENDNPGSMAAQVPEEFSPETRASYNEPRSPAEELPFEGLSDNDNLTGGREILDAGDDVHRKAVEATYSDDPEVRSAGEGYFQADNLLDDPHSPEITTEELQQMILGANRLAEEGGPAAEIHAATRDKLYDVYRERHKIDSPENDLSAPTQEPGLVGSEPDPVDVYQQTQLTPEQEALLAQIPDEPLFFEDSKKVPPSANDNQSGFDLTGAGGEEPPSGGVIERLTAALNNAGKLTAEQKALYTQARREKLGGVGEARATTSGEEGLHAELSQLRGEMPKVDFEGVRDQFTPEEVTSLFDTVKDHPKLGMYTSIRARVGLAKLLDGQLPTQSEINLLSEVFPKDFVRAALKHRSRMTKVMDVAANVANLPRSLMSSFDLSAPLRQGIFMVGRKEFYSAFRDMFKAFGSERAYNGIMGDVRAKPTYNLMEESGLALMDMGYDLSKREEAFMSRWAEKIPVVGQGVKMSERAYTGFLNKLRADVFDDIVTKATSRGSDLAENPENLKALADYINNATGRGNLGKLSQAGPLLNGLFFSPRLIASRVNLLRPDYYVKLPPEVRKEAIRDLVTFGGIATSVITLAKAGGADVETDPRSSDFAKIKTGNTRYDVLGGFGQYLTLGARLASNETKTAKGKVEELGKKYGSRTRLDTLLNFGINKESPIASFITDYLRGKDPIGQPFDLKTAIAKRFVPMFAQDANEVVKEEGIAGVPMAIPGLFGVGIQSYDANTPRSKPSATTKPTIIQEVGSEPSSNAEGEWETIK